jgi:hypothetical protein
MRSVAIRAAGKRPILASRKSVAFFADLPYTVAIKDIPWKQRRYFPIM